MVGCQWDDEPNLYVSEMVGNDHFHPFYTGGLGFQEQIEFGWRHFNYTTVWSKLWNKSFGVAILARQNFHPEFPSCKSMLGVFF